MAGALLAGLAYLLFLKPTPRKKARKPKVSAAWAQVSGCRAL